MRAFATFLHTLCREESQHHEEIGEEMTDDGSPDIVRLLYDKAECNTQK
jgi:hypothetical protein